MSRSTVARIQDILITSELESRSVRLPNLMAENMMMASLAQELAHGSQSFLNNVVMTARHLCKAGGAGIALVKDEDGRRQLHWPAIVGEFSCSEGRLTALEDNPIGYTIQSGQPQLFSHPSRYYPTLSLHGPEIVEGLAIPILATKDDQVIGAIWVVSHDVDHGFDAEDLRVMQALTRYIAAFLEAFDKQERVHQASLSKSFFLANMSHEIRTPLSIILGFSELLKDDKVPAQDRAQFLCSIERNGKLLTKIIDEILDLSKVEAGKVQLEELEFSLKSLVGEVAGVFGEKLQAKSLSLTCFFDEGVPDRVFSDPTRLRQILMNLIGNAVKFTSRGGITLRVSALPSSSPGHQQLMIRVQDSGEGIEASRQKRLFEPFTQAEASTKRRFGGTGLGLLLSKKFAVALGGDVSIESSVPGQGTTFLVRLTVREAEAEKSPAPAAIKKTVEGVRLTGARVLVVDDSSDNLALTGTLLRRHDATVWTASCGEQALQLCQVEPIDLVFLDIQMPGMDGFETLKRLKDMGFAKPVVAMTAHAMNNERRQCFEAGFSYHIPKPFNFDEMLETVRHFVFGAGPTVSETKFGALHSRPPSAPLPSHRPAPSPE